MHDKLLSEIRESCTARNIPVEYLEELVGEYNEVCGHLNERLAKIKHLIVRGHKDEAIQIAEHTPKVLDVVAALDFPERFQWDKLLVSKGINAPRRLAIDHAEELEIAYSEVRRLEPLLKKHRLLALSQAPLTARIQILRQLAEQEPAGMHWQEDLEVYEKARINQLDGEYRKAKAKGDLESLRNLDNELNAQAWIVPVPAHLKKTITRTADDANRKTAIERMKLLSEDLNAAYSEYDSDTAAALRTEWGILNGIAELSPEHSVQQGVEDVFCWLDDLEKERIKEDAFQKSLASLENAVDTSVPINVLDQCIYDAQKFERDIPEGLAHRADQYREKLETNSRRKAIWKYAATLAAVLLATSLVGWFVSQRNYQAQLTDARKSLSKFIADEEYTSGLEFYEELPNSIVKDTEVIALKNKISAAKEDEEDRQKDFAEWKSSFKFFEVLDERMDDLIDAGRKLAKTKDEHDFVDVQVAKLDTERDSKQRIRSQEFATKISQFEKELDALTESDLNDPKVLTELVPLVERLKSAASENKTRNIEGKPFVSEATRREAERVYNKADGHRKKHESLLGASTKIEKIQDALQQNKIEAFAISLEEFSIQFTSHENSEGFKKTVREYSAWQVLLSLSRLVAKTKNDRLSTFSPDSAAFLLEELAPSFQVIDCEADFLPLNATLEEIGATNFDDVDRRKFEDTLKLQKFSNIEVLDLEERFYYLANKINVSPRDRNFSYYPNDESSKPKTKKLPPSRLATGNAPHTSITSKILESIANPKRQSLEEKAFSVFRAALDKPSNDGLKLDHAAHARIVWLTLNYVQKLAPRHMSFWDNAKARLETSGLAIVDFKDVDLVGYAELRAKGKDVIDQTRRAFDEFAVEVEKQHEFDSCQNYMNLQICGWLLKRNGEFKFAPIQEDGENRKLFCLAATNGDKFRLEEIGKFENNKFRPKTEAILQAGRPVFSRISNVR